MIEVKIKGNEKSYPIFTDDYEITQIKEKLKDYIENKKFITVISKKVYKLYGKSLGFDKKDCFILNDGEKEKNFKNYKKILDFCLQKNLTKDDVIIAIGGGVVGDITGFVAATYMRGIDLIQIPTTLLSFVDSSIGGKTAVNTKYGKNLIGSFYQPKAVFINTNFLKTLPEKEFLSGLGEVIKYGFIEKSCGFENYNFLNFLNENHEKIFEMNGGTLKYLIETCIKLKISVVQQDEKESGLRKILNFGHTYGHALEKISNYKKYTHGECVINGIMFAFELAMKNDLIDKSYLFFMQTLLEKFKFKKLPVIETKKLVPILKTDKKSTSKFITFILPTDFSVVKEFHFNEILTIS